MKKWLIIIGVGVLVLALGLFIGIKVFTKHIGRMTVEEALYFAADHLKIEYLQEIDNPAAGTHKFRGITVRPRIHSRFDLDIDECVAVILSGTGPRDLPQRIKVRLSGIRPINARKMEHLSVLGYDDFILETYLDLEIWPEKRRVTLRELSLYGKNAGSLFGHLTLEGLEITLDTTLSQALDRFKASLLAQAELNYEDNSLVERLIKAKAGEEEKSPDEVLQETVARLREKARKEKDAVKAKALEVLAEFIQNPKTITARVEPARPLSIAKIREFKKLSEGEWPPELNLAISAD